MLHEDMTRLHSAGFVCFSSFQGFVLPLTQAYLCNLFSSTFFMYSKILRFMCARQERWMLTTACSRLGFSGVSIPLTIYNSAGTHRRRGTCSPGHRKRLGGLGLSRQATGRGAGTAGGRSTPRGRASWAKEETKLSEGTGQSTWVASPDLVTRIECSVVSGLCCARSGDDARASEVN